MERLIKIENFFIIKATQLDEIASALNLNFTRSNDTYLLTLVMLNIFAYLVIYLFIKLAIRIKRKIFKRRRFY